MHDENKFDFGIGYAVDVELALGDDVKTNDHVAVHTCQCWDFVGAVVGAEGELDVDLVGLAFDGAAVGHLQGDGAASGLEAERGDEALIERRTPGASVQDEPRVGSGLRVVHRAAQ